VLFVALAASAIVRRRRTLGVAKQSVLACLTQGLKYVILPQSPDTSGALMREWLYAAFFRVAVFFVDVETATGFLASLMGVGALAFFALLPFFGGAGTNMASASAR
jgi:hypothetical protein